MELLAIAFRNIWRNKRRSVLNMIALTLGMAMMVIGLGWVGGYHTYLYKALMDFETGHAQLLDSRYRAESRRFPLDLSLEGYTRRREGALKEPGVEEATGRIDFSVKMSFGTESVFLAARAVDPVPESRVTILKKQVVEGAYLDGPGILVGKSLAHRLGLNPGDAVYISSRDRHGVENLVVLPVSGLFHFGYPVLDDNLVFVDLKSASGLLAMEDRVTRMVYKLKETVSPEAFVSASNAKKTDGETAMYLWKEFVQGTVSAVEADSGGFYFMIVVMYVLTILGMLNSMSMSVEERTREIGTLRAIGMRRGVLMKIILMESALIAALAAVAAFVIAFPVAVWLGGFGIDFAQYVPGNMPIPFGEKFRADFQWWQIAFTLAVGVLTALFGAVIPARRAANMRIADAMAGGIH